MILNLNKANMSQDIFLNTSLKTLAFCLLTFINVKGLNIYTTSVLIHPKFAFLILIIGILFIVAISSVSTSENRFLNFVSLSFYVALSFTLPTFHQLFTDNHSVMLTQELISTKQLISDYIAHAISIFVLVVYIVRCVLKFKNQFKDLTDSEIDIEIIKYKQSTNINNKTHIIDNLIKFVAIIDSLTLGIIIYSCFMLPSDSIPGIYFVIKRLGIFNLFIILLSLIFPILHLVYFRKLKKVYIVILFIIYSVFFYQSIATITPLSLNENKFISFCSNYKIYRHNSYYFCK